MSLVWAGVTVRRSVSVLVFRSTCECGVPVEYVFECFTITVSTHLDQQVNWRTVGWMRGSWIQTGVLGRLKGCASARKICKCQCAYEPGECDVYAALVTLCLCEPKRWRRCGWLNQYLVSCDRGCCWRHRLFVAVCWLTMSMSSECVCPCLCLWDMCSALVLVEPEKRIREKEQLHPSAWAEVPSPWDWSRRLFLASVNIATLEIYIVHSSWRCSNSQNKTQQQQ